MECQRLLALHVEKFKAGVASLSHNRTSDHVSGQKCFQHSHNALQLSVNRVSTILGLAYSKINEQCDIIDQ
jgi:hypothetical protein